MAAHYIPDAGALTVAHNSVAAKGFGMRFDLLSYLLPPGITCLRLICKTRNLALNTNPLNGPKKITVLSSLTSS